MKHASTPPIGEPGALSHPQALFHIGSHSSAFCSDFSGLRNVPATKCKPTPTTPTTTHPPLHTTISLTRAHSTSAACAAETQDNAQSTTAHTPHSHPQAQLPARPPPPLSCPKVRAPWTGPTKSLYTTSPAALCHTGGFCGSEAGNSSTPPRRHCQQLPATLTGSQMPPIPPVLAEPFQAEAEAPTEQQQTPGQPHRADNNGKPDTTPDTDRQHTRAHWFKTHIAQPSKKGRTKHDVQTPPTAPPPRRLLEHRRIAGSS